MIESEKSRVHLFFLLAVTALGFGLRLAHLSEPSLWWDEFITLGVAKLDFSRMAHILSTVGPSDIGCELFPPLYHSLVRLCLGVGESDAAVRLPSVIFGTLTIPAVYFLGRTLFSKNAGLFAAAFCAVSAYHLNYSRELRPYSLYLFLAILSMAFFYRAFKENHLRDWAAYILSTIAMFYTAYTATTIVMAQGLFVALSLGLGLIRRETGVREAIRKGLPFALALGCLALLYLPWIGAYRTVYMLLRDPNASPSIPLEFIISSLQEFAAYSFVTPEKPWMLFTGLAIFGALAAFPEKKREQLALIALWAFVPVAAFLTAKTVLTLSSRYFFNVFFFMLITAGFGLDVLTTRLFSALRAKSAASRLPGVLAGLLLCLVVNLPNIRSLPDFYKREASYNKELASFLLWGKNNIDYLAFTTSRNQKLIADWYVGDGFKRLSGFADRAYKRAYLLGPAEWTPNAGEITPLFVTRIMDASVHACGLPNRAPIALYPGKNGTFVYKDDYRSLNFYADAYAAKNMAPDLQGNALVHYDYDKPASTLYKFTLPEGLAAKNVRLTLRMKMIRIENTTSDSRVTIQVGDIEDGLRGLEEITYASYLDEKGELPPPNVEKKFFLERTYPLDAAFVASRDLFIRIHYAPVMTNGVIELESLELAADLTGEPTQQDPAAAAFANVAANTAIMPWTPGVAAINSTALYAFRLKDAHAPESGDAPQSAGDHAAFLEDHPGARPVLTLPGADGEPAIALYDPALTAPGVALRPGETARLMLGAAPFTAKSMKLSGAMDRPALTMGGQTLTIPILAPSDSTVALNAGSDGLLRISPAFVSDASLTAALPLGENMRKNEGEDCVSCKENSPCFAAIPISSDYPIRQLRIEYYPRVFSDLERTNILRLSYSLDGKAFTPLDALQSSGSLLWEGLMVRRVALADFTTPVHNLFIRFDLSGQGAQLWSRIDTRMTIEATLDASHVPPLTLHSRRVNATLSGNAGAPLDLILLPEPVDLRQDLKDNY